MFIPTLPSIRLISLFLLSLLILSSSQDNHTFRQNCPNSFKCGTNGLNIEYPLYNSDTHPGCGLITVGCNSTVPKIYIDWTSSSKNNIELQADKFLDKQSVNVSCPKLQDYIRLKNCKIFSYLNALYYSQNSVSYTISPSLTLFECDTSSINFTNSTQRFINNNYYEYRNCSGSIIYYPRSNHTSQKSYKFPAACRNIKLPVNEGKLISKDLFTFLGNKFTLRWNLSSKCSSCHLEGGICSGKTPDFRCLKKGKGKKKLKTILATVIPGCAIVTIIMAILTIHYRNKWKDASIYISSRNKSDHEGCGFFLGVPVFSYAELEEATNDFDPSRELGDGGYGTVYHGKLRDGREVAVKRLYEHNFKRLTQFQNEIKILTRIRHKNLVTLYGCSSGRGRELLLVYEYIPNGTVADHLHGNLAKDGPLTWPIRMNIAIETASALAYLHKSDIIHRDVKTNNILIDNNFCVKVADFGLSRLFPNDVTHVSTAPQGTPGYVDPEYHQCYQLTDKSDVYSFGVVLIELVSSMPAVDISRHRNEINLASMAMNKIQNRALEELIDPFLGFKTDPSVERMITSVIEVAFRCLQLEKEMRPSMDEILDILTEIHDYKETRSRKEMIPPSPDSVVDKWISATTSISSG